MEELIMESFAMQGVGFPLDIVVCSALGADMYDCVYPTRTARFGTALVPEVTMISFVFFDVSGSGK
mgnify:FL=1